jgi:tetrahydromethanopterin S-methyltransferase subunit F
LYVINIGNPSPAGWYLESTHKGMGVMSSGAVFKTDFGLVWANPNGLYAYQTGGGIAELTEDKVLSGYKTDSYGVSSWGKLITTGTIVGYDKKEKEIVVVLNSGSVTNDQSFGGNGADVVVYDLETKSFFFGKNRLLSAGVASNFDYDWNGDLAYASETSDSVTIKAWQSDDQTSTGFVYQTKDFDFGTPSRYKKVYAIYLTYKHSDSNAATNFVKYVQDGGTSFITTNLSNNSLDVASTFEIAKVTFDTPLKCQSIALQLNGPTSNATKLEINDIGIEYRLLPAAKVAAT